MELSGQEQRLLLTRLFYHNPCLSIIDEGTSALDKHNELKFYQAYQSLQKSNSKHSAIFIAHRPMALYFCDEVIHLDSGKIEFFGTTEKYKNSPYYKGIFEAK